MTDYIVLSLLAFNFLRGWFKGLAQSLLGPISLILAAIASYAYFIEHKDLTLALVIGVFGPFVIHICLALVLKVWNKATRGDIPPSMLSRGIGGLFLFIWSGAIIALTLMLISVVTVNFPWFNKVQRDVLASRSYTLMRRVAGDRLPVADPAYMKAVTHVLEDPAKLSDLRKTEEYQKIMTDEKILALMDDKKLVEQIENQEIMKLISNPKIIAILEDEELLKSFFALNKMITERNQGAPAN